jgi:hypothetical protein
MVEIQQLAIKVDKQYSMSPTIVKIIRTDFLTKLKWYFMSVKILHTPTIRKAPMRSHLDRKEIKGAIALKINSALL